VVSDWRKVAAQHGKSARKKGRYSVCDRVIFYPIWVPHPDRALGFFAARVGNHNRKRIPIYAVINQLMSPLITNH